MDNAPKDKARKFLADVPEATVFWCHDGQLFHNMKELGEGLKKMSDDTYIYHANIQKQDFYNWVKDVIGDELLAADLHKALTRMQAIDAVSDRLHFLAGKA